jgi:hypothetical protein
MRYHERRSKGQGLIQPCLYLSCFLLIAILVFQYPAFAQSDEVHVFISGPDTLPTNTTAQYTIQITGGPAEEMGNWIYEAWLESPKGIRMDTDPEPQNGSSTENIFTINITTPEKTQIIYLNVNGTSTNETDTVWSGDVSKEIKVFEPITVNITASIRNTHQIDVKGAVVSFYFDGELIGNKTLDVQANSTEKVYLVWLVPKTEEGEHDVEVRINEDGNLLEFNDGDNVMRNTIYVGKRPSREMGLIMVFNTGLVFFIDVMAFFFFIGAFWMRRKTIRGRGYYSTAATNSLYFLGLLMIVLSIPVFYVSQILSENPEVDGDPIGRMIEGIWIFVLGFGTILLNWDRTRKKRR